MGTFSWEDQMWTVKTGKGFGSFGNIIFRNSLTIINENQT
jgi:hypothetical protein